MPNDDAFPAADYEWQPCRIVIPRTGLWIDHHGVRSRLIMPGRYLVRRSRTFRRKLYRFDDR
ncbi:MAG: hypothetical protein LCH74_13720 [Proteobacteria bacterium]|nr:hypothetical protein [Pseudomonadota bacterium]